MLTVFPAFFSVAFACFGFAHFWLDFTFCVCRVCVRLHVSELLLVSLGGIICRAHTSARFPPSRYPNSNVHFAPSRLVLFPCMGMCNCCC